MSHSITPPVHEWLRTRGISDEVITRFNLSMDNERLVIPVYDTDGTFLFNKYRTTTDITGGTLKKNTPKYTYDTGAQMALYGTHVIESTRSVFICEGELDALLLWSKGWQAVTSTGGAHSFQESWGSFFQDMTTYILYDNDDAGIKGAFRTQKYVPHAKIIWLPGYMRQGSDVTDFFQRYDDALSRLDNMLHHARSYDMSIIPEASITTKKRRHEVLEEYDERIRDVAQEYSQYVPVKVATVYGDIFRREIAQHQHILRKPKKPQRDVEEDSEDLQAAKQVPVSHYLDFNSKGYTTCLWHKPDRNPSLYWYEKSNRVHCFACGEGGDVLDVVQEKFNKTLPEAIAYVLNQ